jgi:hypothetical protein
MGTRKQAGSNQRPSGMREGFIGSQGPQRNVALEKEEEEDDEDDDNDDDDKDDDGD